MKIEDVRSNSELINMIENGQECEYIFFWGHRKNKNGQVGKSCFSQWYESPFCVNNQMYLCAEHYMMAEKARLYNDMATWEKIVNVKDPKEAKQYGREVKNFDEAIWMKNRFQIVVNGNKEKFSQDKELLKFLLYTKDKVLVEASPVDKIWGIGLAEDNADVSNPLKWDGLNLLGYALMEVRTQLRV